MTRARDGNSGDGGNFAAPDAQRVTVTFFSSALQYYVAGRFALLAGFAPVAGTLFHHAIELALKGALAANRSSLAELGGFGRNLPRLWHVFKALHRDAGFERFDEAVSKLQTFEGLRYPDSVLSQARQVEIGIAGRSAGAAAADPDHETMYALCLDEVDALISALLHRSGQEPGAYTCGSQGAARDYLVAHNPVAELTAAAVETIGGHPGIVAAAAG